MRVHPATPSLHTTMTLGRNATPSPSTTTLGSEKIMGTKTREMVDMLVSPSNTWVKLIAHHLAQKLERETRQRAPRRTFLVTSPFKLENVATTIKPCNTLQCSGVIITPPSHFNTQSIRVPTTPVHLSFLRKNIPARHRPGVKHQP